MVTTVYLLGGDVQIDNNGDMVSGSTGSNSAYIPLAVGRIEYKLQREPTALPIPVLGITAIIDYNVRHQFFNLTDIILADGTGGSSIFGRVIPDGPKGWNLFGRNYSTSAGETGGINKKELQRALLSRVVGASYGDYKGKGPIDPLIIVWGNPSDTDVPYTITDESSSNLGDKSPLIWSHVKVTNFTIAQVAGEPTKYECTLDCEIYGLGARLISVKG